MKKLRVGEPKSNGEEEIDPASGTRQPEKKDNANVPEESSEPGTRAASSPGVASISYGESFFQRGDVVGLSVPRDQSSLIKTLRKPELYVVMSSSNLNHYHLISNIKLPQVLKDCG